jgi:hypothetical protein
MAWRLAKSIIRGEIDNTKRGVVRGELWLLGNSKPIRLELQGNAHRDLAGCRLLLVNRNPQPGEPVDLAETQTGVVGDMTASRKYRVIDATEEEALVMADEGKPVPEYRKNGVYLEWFSETNGRVVIESVDLEIRVSERAWTLNEHEERQQVEANLQAIRVWLDRLSNIEEEDDEDYDPGDEEPMDEFEWEQFLKESDQLTDRYSEALDKYRDNPDCERLVAREMGWTWLEEALEAKARGALTEDDIYDEDDGEDDDDPQSDPLQPNPLTEGTDWVRDENGRVQHPLTLMAHRISLGIWRQCEELGVLTDNGDEDIKTMVFQAQTLSAKLAGALNHLAYETEPEPGFVVACLKRSLTFLHEAIGASERIRTKPLIPQATLDEFRNDLFQIRERVLALMERFRQKKW